MKKHAAALILAILMVGTSLGSYALRPGEIPEGMPPSIVLKDAIPLKFGDWTFLPDTTVRVIDPPTETVINKIYGETLTRTYANKAGDYIMLSLAYGKDQRDGLTAHKPEICYPAQGFTVNSLHDGFVVTPYGKIEATRLATNMGSRQEPVTYWFTEGDEVVKSRFSRRMAQMRAYLTGQIPDGVLFRVSSIDENTAKAFAVQQQFAVDLLASVSTKDLKKLGGLTVISPKH